MSAEYVYPALYNEVFCPSCGYLSGSSYLPNLLLSPEEFECPRCSAKFGYAVDPEEKGHIRKLIKLAKEYESLSVRKRDLSDILHKRNKKKMEKTI